LNLLINSKLILSKKLISIFIQLNQARIEFQMSVGATNTYCSYRLENTIPQKISYVTIFNLKVIVLIWNATTI